MAARRAPLCGKYELFAEFILTDSEGVKSWIATTVFLLVLKPLSASCVCPTSIVSGEWSVFFVLFRDLTGV